MLTNRTQLTTLLWLFTCGPLNWITAPMDE